MEAVKEAAPRTRENSSNKPRRLKERNATRPEIITEEDFEAFCSGKTDLLLTGVDTPAPPESRLGTGTPRYENSYRLEPDKTVRTGEIQKIIEEALNEALEETEYDHDEARRQSLLLCELLKEKVKSFNYPRFRFVCSVQIGENNEQRLCIGSRCLWNKTFDTFARGVFSNRSLYAVGCVYAVYFE